MFGSGAAEAFGGAGSAAAPRLCARSDPPPYYSDHGAYGCAEGAGYRHVDVTCKCGYVP